MMTHEELDKLQFLLKRFEESYGEDKQTKHHVTSIQQAVRLANSIQRRKLFIGGKTLGQQ